jgi:predicted alpha/beta hydrolase family esterase
MLTKIVKTLKTKQPIATTGIFAHAYHWLVSPNEELYYANPSFLSGGNDDTATAIYFIHGTFDKSSALNILGKRLMKAGLADAISSLHLLAFDQRYQGKSIEFFATQLQNKINENKHQRVILIAHSRGGLVASYFAEFLAGHAGIKVPLIITVGTPFNGSYLAMQPLSWFSDSVKEMSLDSGFLLQLKKKILDNSITRYHFFIAENDTIVPGESGYIKEYINQQPSSLSILKRHGHLSILSSHCLVEAINYLLKDYCTNEKGKVLSFSA